MPLRLTPVQQQIEDLPQHHFGAILADPPWGFQCWDGKDKKVASRGSVTPYLTMDMDEIGKLPVDNLAAKDCALFMWVVWPTLPKALEVIESWGFTYKTCAFAWLKADQYRLFTLDEDVYMGLGYWTRANSEVCLLATRGKPKRLNADVRQGIIAPRREHSRKPDGIHKRIERLVTGPYIELFAREQRSGWTTWGNETEKFGRSRTAETWTEMWNKPFDRPELL
jgi:N6-adenosine-specific RNA methylase IME4